MTRFAFICSLCAAAIMGGAWTWAVNQMDAAAAPPAGWQSRLGATEALTPEEALSVLAVLPVLAIGLSALLAVLARLEPFRGNLQLGAKAFLVAAFGAQFLLVGASWTLAYALTAPNASDLAWRGLSSGACVLLAVVGDTLPKTRRNFLLGVRTPWTLTSDLAWEKTHRLAGRSFVLIGLWGAAVSFVLSPLTLGWAIAAPALTVAILCIGYSYVVWRADPERAKGDVLHD